MLGEATRFTPNVLTPDIARTDTSADATFGVEGLLTEARPGAACRPTVVNWERSFVWQPGSDYVTACMRQPIG